MSEIPVPEGTRVKAVKWGPSDLVDDNETVPPGTLGTVIGGYQGRPHDQIWVKWDNGSSISLIPPHDEFEIVKEPHA